MTDVRVTLVDLALLGHRNFTLLPLVRPDFSKFLTIQLEVGSSSASVKPNILDSSSNQDSANAKCRRDAKRQNLNRLYLRYGSKLESSCTARPGTGTSMLLQSDNYFVAWNLIMTYQSLSKSIHLVFPLMFTLSSQPQADGSCYFLAVGDEAGCTMKRFGTLHHISILFLLSTAVTTHRGPLWTHPVPHSVSD